MRKDRKGSSVDETAEAFLPEGVARALLVGDKEQMERALREDRASRRGKAHRGGSCDHAARVAAKAFLDDGCTNLETKFAVVVASYGDVCWVNDTAVQRMIWRPDGRRYNRESIGNARRKLAREGRIKSKRIVPGRKPDKKADYVTSTGTTAKSIEWSRLGHERTPMARGARRRARQRQEAACVPPSTPAYTSFPERTAAPRYSESTPLPTQPLPVDDPLAIEMARLERALQHRWASSSAPTDGSSPTGGASAGAELDAPESAATGPPE